MKLEEQNYINNCCLFNKQLKILRKFINDTTPITHVGSTSIPTIKYGKNIIDILIGAKNESDFDTIKKILLNLNFFASENSKTNIYQFFASKQEETTSGDIHIHLVLTNTERYNEFLILKRYLLENTYEAKAYSQLKLKLLNNGINDRKEYKKIKSEYVCDLINRAKSSL